MQIDEKWYMHKHFKLCFSIIKLIIEELVKKGGSMQLLATQPYIKIMREVTRIGKTETEDRRMMYLYVDKLVTKYREFPIDHVIDMSFRAFGTTGGLLYVYTSSGVFSYTVTSSPAEFIQAFKTYFHI